ncbi:stage II sporulation protein M [Dehalobacter sp. DCM]|uniref:stage II sporulation protein M n=1 Tax=Dehalobacter sp. DCM TaxID=2907827 RepID=UPI003081993C|nr:stage II sporulation protein M [Dehalobacter sp. DCM]
MKKLVFEHIRRFWVIYLTLCCVFLAGCAFGAVGINSLGTDKAQELTDFLNKLLGGQPDILNTLFLQQLARDNFIIMAAILILGLTVIGAPLVYLIVFSRGFILGFTIAFILHAKQWAGLGLLLITVVCPSLIAVPCLLFGSGMATVFSFLLLQGKLKGDFLKRDFFHYCAAGFLVSLGALAAGVLQGYFSTLGIRFLGY